MPITINRYTAGSLVRLTAEFTDLAKAPTDPTTVLFSYRNPDGVITRHSWSGVDGVIVQDGTGLFHADIPQPVISGVWYYRWEGTGAVDAAGEHKFYIEQSRLT